MELRHIDSGPDSRGNIVLNHNLLNHFLIIGLHSALEQQTNFTSYISHLRFWTAQMYGISDSPRQGILWTELLKVSQNWSLDGIGSTLSAVKWNYADQLAAAIRFGDAETDAPHRRGNCQRHVAKISRENRYMWETLFQPQYWFNEQYKVWPYDSRDKLNHTTKSGTKILERCLTNTGPTS